jgi:hypothetical protein
MDEKCGERGRSFENQKAKEVITPPEAETHHSTAKQDQIHTHRNENRSRRNTPQNQKIANKPTTRNYKPKVTAALIGQFDLRR